MEVDDPIRIPSCFTGFDPNREVHLYRRNLPHWRQDGATYFVTFRLADSLPASAARDLEIERRNFIERVEKQNLEGEALRKASDVFWKRFGRLLDEVLDRGEGSCLLREPEISTIVLDAIRFFEGEQLNLFAAVVMSNHCHVLLRPLTGFSLEKILESWKGFTARKINSHLQRQGPVWQGESYDRIVRDENHFRQVVRYIRKNPIKAQLARSEYKHWEARSDEA